jgi:hypothetical protein
MTSTTTPLPERRAVAVATRLALDNLIWEATRLHRDVNRLPREDELDELRDLERRADAARTALRPQ